MWKPIAEAENQYTCVSEDSKPTNVPVNSIAIELDTGDVYYWDGTDWSEVGG